MKLILEYTHPPIGVRSFDWVCYLDGEEDGLHGYGRTAVEAVEEFLLWHEELGNVLAELFGSLLCDYKPMVKKTRDGKWLIQFTSEIAEDLP